MLVLLLETIRLCNLFTDGFLACLRFLYFRRTYRFLVGVALASSYLIGVTISRIYGFLGEGNLHSTDKYYGKLVSKLNFKHKALRLKFAKIITVLLLFVVIWPNVFPLTQGNFGGLSGTAYPKGYEDVNNWLAGQPGNFRVLVLPLSMLGNWSLPNLPNWTSVGYADLPFINSQPQPIIVQPSAIAMSQGSQSVLYYLVKFYLYGSNRPFGFSPNCSQCEIRCRCTFD